MKDKRERLARGRLARLYERQAAMYDYCSNHNRNASHVAAFLALAALYRRGAVEIVRPCLWAVDCRCVDWREVRELLKRTYT